MGHRCPKGHRDYSSSTVRGGRDVSPNECNILYTTVYKRYILLCDFICYLPAFTFDSEKSVDLAWNSLHGSLAYPEYSKYHAPASCALQKAACFM